MPATDLVYNTVDPLLFTPDYSFLRYTLDKAQSRYDQGLDAVSKAYNSLKRPVTDPVNQQRRDQFLKDAEGQLQKIASSDLSLQQNVNAANNVFEPLATNSAFLYDAFQTDRINKSLNEMKQWSESDDMDVRKKFNPKIYDWVSNQLDILKNGKGDINNYKSMPNRSAFAYVDPQDIINKAIKDTGATFSKDIDGGVYVYGTENGMAFKKNYNEFAKYVLNSNPVYKQQASILGESDYESLLKQGKQAGKNDQQTLSDFAYSNYDAVKTSTSTYLDSTLKTLQKKGKDLFAEQNTLDVSTQEGQAKYQDLMQRRKELDSEIAEYNSLKSNYNDQFGSDAKSIEEKKNAYIQNFLKDPKGSISQQYIDNDINTFSNIRSTFEKTTIKPNTAYFESMKAVNEGLKIKNDIEKGIVSNEIKQEGVDVKQQHEDWLEAGKPIAGKTIGMPGVSETETVSTINPDGTITTSKKPKKPELTYIGQSATDITKKLNTLTAISNQIDMKTAKSLDNLAAGADGGAISLLNTFGVNAENIQTARDFFIKQQNQLIKDPTKPYKPNSEESKALNDVYSSLFAFAKNHGEEDVLNKLRANYGKKPEDIDFFELLDLAISQTKFTDPKDLAHVNQWQEHKKANKDIEYLSGILSTSRQAVVNYINSTPENKKEYKDVLIERDGKPAILDVQEMIKRIPKKGWFENVNWATDPPVTLTDDDVRNIAQGYINGTLDVRKKHEHIKLGGDDPTDGLFDDDPGVYIKYNGKEIYLPFKGLDVFPLSTDDLQKKFAKINDQTSLPEISDQFKDELFASPIWGVTGDMGKRIIQSLATPGGTQYSSNIFETADGNNFKQVDDADDIVALRNAMTDPKNIAENGINVHTKSNANGGGVAVAVTFAPANTKDEGKACTYCGRTVYFPIAMGKGTPDELAVYNTVNDQTEYNRIKDTGKMYRMFDFSAMGITVDILPHTKGSPNGDVIFTMQQYDPTTKTYIPNKFETVRDFYTTETRTYDEMKDETWSKIVQPFLLNRINVDRQAAAQQGGAAGASLDKNLITKGLVIPQ